MSKVFTVLISVAGITAEHASCVSWTFCKHSYADVHAYMHIYHICKMCVYIVYRETCMHAHNTHSPCVHIHVYAQTNNTCIHTQTPMNTCTCTYTRVNTNTHARTRVHARTHTHKHAITGGFNTDHSPTSSDHMFQARSSRPRFSQSVRTLSK